MEAGARIWISDAEGDDAWILAEVKSRTAALLTAFPIHKPSSIIERPHLESESKSKEGDNDAPGELKYEGVELANNPLSETEQAEGKDNDMITLPHLHEPAILHAIGERFDRGEIYTWTGPVLIAVNPFQRLPLYTNEILEKYRRAGLLRSQGMGSTTVTLDPHIYAIADLSYRQMMAPGRKSQAILISGESGAGKTESTKIVMLYLTTLGMAANAGGGSGEIVEKRKSNGNGELTVMEKVLQSNPILEAFGNARTLRNDNSSRFGKFIELGFSRSGSLLGAKVQTYLLEKVRLGFHASGERNYHIFYQLLRGATEDQKRLYNFHDGDTHGIELCNYFHYTGQGGAPTLREFTDEEGLGYTLKAMKSIWQEEKVSKVLALCAGLLHLGQVNFDSVENEGGQQVAAIAEGNAQNSLTFASDLLGVDMTMLKTALTERILVTRGEAITIQLAPEKASDSRDALTKTIYGALFLWVVQEVNQSILWEKDGDVRSSVGVLDIFGFECFAINSFEQLCINFTNEALQQQFNKFIFKMEQAEYEREEINWDFISFPDNQDCLDTIQSRPSGILAMLDDEARLGARGNDRNWADRLYKHFIPNKNQVESDNTRFSATPIEKSRSIFTIRHFAGPVKYTATTGFLEKNKDEIPVTAHNLFDFAESWLIKEIYAVQKKETEEGACAKSNGKPAKTKTVGQQFKEQLTQLMTKIETVEPHYIRCLKPNDAAKPNMMTRRRLTEQLRYGGVLEAVRVARMGFPVRMNHDLFFQEYRKLLPSVGDEKLSWSLSGNAQALCVRLVDMLLVEGKKDHDAGPKNPNEEGIGRFEKVRRLQLRPIPMVFPKTDVQLGKNKVFMRKPAHDALEAHRVFHQTAAATILQAWIRGLQKRVRFLITSEAVLDVQRFYRGCKGRERWWKLREDVAGQLLTNHFRMLIVRRRFARAKFGIVLLQGFYRGHATRRELATIKIQSQHRMRKQYHKFRLVVKASIALQCRLRRGIAKKVLAELKYEQKDIGKLKQNNEKLKLEMASLKAMLAAEAKGSAGKAASEMQLREKEEEIAKLEKRIHHLEAELAREKETAKKLELKLEKEKSRFAKREEDITSLRQQNKNLKSNAAAAQAAVYQLPPGSPRLVPPASPRPRAQLPQHRSVESIPKMPDLEPELQTSSSAEVQTEAQTVYVEKIVEIDVHPAQLAEQKALVQRLEEELNKERRSRMNADGEVIRLRAEINGVTLDDAMIQALIPEGIDKQKPDLMPVMENQSSFTTHMTSATDESTDGGTVVQLPPLPPQPSSPIRARQPTIAASIENDINKGMDNLRNLIRSPSDFLPMIRRGHTKEAQSKDMAPVGWNANATSRKEREEALRDSAHNFEMKQNKFSSMLEHGIEVSMWQLNRNADFGSSSDDFPLKGSPMHIKLARRGDMLVQASLVFSMKGGYLSKALSRRKVDKTALEPLSITEILGVSAGCEGYDHNNLPSSSRKSKKGENKNGSLFITIKGTPTPLASSRLYFLKFKSRSVRNDLLMGLRGLLADLQVNEGISISTIQNPSMNSENNATDTPRRMSSNLPQDADKILVPLPEVHKAINSERESYDRLLLLMLQGSTDLKNSEDDLVGLRGTLEAVFAESKEKDKIQANDSKLIMQLSKKLETLLMDNEDLRDQNENLNHRIITLENEKVGVYET